MRESIFSLLLLYHLFLLDSRARTVAPLIPLIDPMLSFLSKAPELVLNSGMHKVVLKFFLNIKAKYLIDLPRIIYWGFNINHGCIG